MKNVIVLMGMVLISFSSIFSQDITFEDGVILFEHPSDRDPLIFNPFLPINLNNDDVVDFVGTLRGGFDGEALFFTSDEDGVLNLSSFVTDDNTAVAQVIDFNNDGLDDVLFRDGIWINGEDNRITEFYFPEGLDRFLVSDEYLGVADFNNDGMHDILVNRIISGEDDDLAILMSDGQGGFSNVTLNTQPDIGDHNIIDVNGDGFLDVAIIELDRNINVGGISIYFGDGEGNFSDLFLSGFAFVPFGSIFGSLEFADMDADGDLDIIYPTEIGVVVVENLGNQEGGSEFAAVADDDFLEFSSTAAIIRVGDMNSDGFPDIVGAGAFNELYYAENDGNGSFIELEIVGPSGETDYIYPENFFVALSHTTNNLNLFDFDSDGDLDVLYLNHSSEDFLLFENRPLSTSTDDLQLSDIEFGPNPSFDFITLTGSDTQEVESYRIYDNLGRLVQNGIVQSDRLNLVGLTNGSYILQLFDRNSELFLNEKFVFIGSR